MKFIILGFPSCPHCRALMRLFKETQDICDVGYIDLSTMINNHMSESDKMLYIERLQSAPIALPYVLLKRDDKWEQVDLSNFTRSLIMRYSKQITSRI